MHRSIPSVVVLGDGLLGSEIVKQTGWDNISRKKDEFNITEPDKFHTFFVEDCYEGIIFASKYNVIINCIADTNTYSLDKEPQWKVNYKGVADLTDFCNTWDIKLVHISSDYVYTNSQQEASENNVPIHGNNWYSYTKLLADAYIELKSKNYLICRGTHKEKPFNHPLSWINQIGNFDYVDKIAELIIKLVNSDAVGLYNVGTELKTMSDLARQTNPKSKPFIINSNYTPLNVSMDLNKLNEWLSKNL